MKLVKTESGSIYEIDLQNMRVRRANESHGLRRDGAWTTMVEKPDIKVGRGMVIHLEPLGDCIDTFRYSTPVSSVKVVRQPKEQA